MITKGKWKVYEDTMACVLDVVSEDGMGFFNVTVAHINRKNDEYEANAQLIASAPDLYEALKDILNRFNISMDYKLDGNWNKAIQALAEVGVKE